MQAWVLEAVGESVRRVEVAEPQLKPGGVIIRVLSAHVPSYTRAVVDGSRGYVFPTPLVLGPACVGEVEAVAQDVFHVEVGDIVLNSSFLSSGDTDRPADDILVGWTGIGWAGVATPRSQRMQSVWHDGVFGEKALCPKESLTRLPGAETYPDPTRLSFLTWLAIAGEGLERSELRAGQTIVVSGATGQLGGAATLVALARGAARIVAVGRNTSALDRLAALDGRVVPVALGGDRSKDAAAVLAATDGRGADVVIDLLGEVATPDPTLACFDAMRPGATMVLVGGVKQDLPLPYGQLMRKRLTVRGSFMFSSTTVDAVWNLIRAGAIDLRAIGVQTVGLDDPEAAIDAASKCSGLDIVSLLPSS